MSDADRLAAAADRYIEIWDDRHAAWRLGMKPTFTFAEKVEAQREFDSALEAYRKAKGGPR